uniref:helix-turn-helix domain-containing protein n=1 Tax=Salinispora arenicola TaxID=168697 RepID=UPI001E59F6ED
PVIRRFIMIEAPTMIEIATIDAQGLATTHEVVRANRNNRCYVCAMVGRERNVLNNPQMVEHIREECRVLGRQLAARRLLAELNQAELGIQIGYSRSTVASVETGRTRAHRDFWERCDHELAAGGELMAGFRRLDALVREYHQQLEQERL